MINAVTIFRVLFNFISLLFCRVKTRQMIFVRFRCHYHPNEGVVEICKAFTVQTNYFILYEWSLFRNSRFPSGSE